MHPNIKAFYEQVSGTIAYILYDQDGGSAAIIDSVLGYDPKSGRTNTEHADTLIDFIQQQQLTVEWLLETHAHADHLSASPYLQKKLGGKIAIGERIHQVQKVFKGVFNLRDDFPVDGRQFDYLFKDNECFQVGALTVQIMFVPGHTPADTAFLTHGHLFLGDTLFMPDVGTARCDFPGGSVEDLYDSIQRILSLPAETCLYACHDYPPNEREPMWVSTVAEQKLTNIHVHDGITKEQFITMRTARDKTLSAPVLLLPSIQVNIRAGHFPEPETNGVSYLKIPLNFL